MGQSASSRRGRDGDARRTSSTAGGVGLACALSVELSPLALPAGSVQLPVARLFTPSQDPTEDSAAADSAQLRAPRAVTARWLLPAPDSAAGSVLTAEHAETVAARAADVNSDDAAPGVVTNDAALLRGAQLAATRRELDGARDKILRLLQQVVVTQAARDRALEQANQQVHSPRLCRLQQLGRHRVSRAGTSDATFASEGQFVWVACHIPTQRSSSVVVHTSYKRALPVKHAPREPLHRASTRTALRL